MNNMNVVDIIIICCFIYLLGILEFLDRSTEVVKGGPFNVTVTRKKITLGQFCLCILWPFKLFIKYKRLNH